MSRPTVVDLLCPELYARDGGVQNYGRTLLKGLLQVLPAETRLRVFVRNDFSSHMPVAVDPRLELHPCGSRLPLLSLLQLVLVALMATMRRRPALVIATHPHLAPLQLLLGRLAGCPTWAAAHGIDVWTLRFGLRRWALQRLELVLPVSRYTRDQLHHQLGRRCPELVVLPNSFNQNRFRPGPRPVALLERYSLRPEQPLIFSITRLSSKDCYKHIDALITAMPELRKLWPDLVLLIGGDGDDRPRLRRRVQQLRLSEAVLLPGRIADAELADHYRLSSLFALPSEGEGFGIVFLEALGCGKPVLAGNRDGSVDPLADGAFGCLVDPRLPLAPPLRALLEGYGEELWFRPEALSAAVAERFGSGAFLAGLQSLLARLPVLGVEA
ncbi:MULTISPECIES: glycosyltransferase [unclassified Synechococcus]|uniref:glycosyltransferase n=1 Tax=unclassified Synechococcus TaxID=2626047 RepID=UPI0008FF23F6|nr:MULTISPECIES: glycosyltransferase [unclassified Synechococcus]APD48723.1 hypothetical protein BM449_11345 [Synechococcus sp. SynAce01]MCT0245656.1 glycosyltransferase [Synechococcus sp. CS-601]TWB95308.1 glycosyltransferase involved in cell wall biosynthesis [Synechococcus sp. Ace-Pa]